MMKQLAIAGAASIALLTPAHAVTTFVTSGKTSVDLDLDTLASVGLNLSSTSNTTDPATGFLTAFSINSRGASAPSLPTTFAYDAPAVAPFSGTIEHAGTVLFNADTTPLEVGNFTIGYDMTRVGDGRSGFFVADNVTFPATALFDIQDTLVPSAMVDSLVITGPGSNGGVPLLVSAELAGVLGDSGLAGAPVGEARVDAISAVPEASPGFLLTAVTLFGLAARRRRRQS